MELQLIRLRRIPNSKTGFIVDLLIDRQPVRTRVFVRPRFGNSIEFPEDATSSAIFRTGRKARQLGSAIVAAYRGEKVHCPISFHDVPPGRNLLLTVKANRRSLSLVGN